MVQRRVTITIEGEDQLSGPAKKAAGSLGSLEKAAKSYMTVQFAKKVAQGANELVHLGAQSLMARDRLVAFAGGSANATAMMQSLIDASDGTIDRLTATEKAARLLQMGIVDTTQEMGMAGAIVGKLGDQTLSLERRMQDFTLMMANQSKLRLDTFGLSMQRVTTRQKELEAQGYSTQDAFKKAVYEEAEGALGKLGDTSDSAATKLGRVEASAKNVKTAAGEMVVEIAQSTDGLGDFLDKLADGLTKLPGWVETMGTLAEGTISAGEGFLAGRDAADAFNQVILKSLLYTEGLSEQTKALRDPRYEAAAAAKAQGEAEKELTEVGKELTIAEWAEIEAVKAMTRARELAESALKAQIAERRRGEELEDFARRRESIERSHQEVIASIIASGQQTAAAAAQEGYRARLDALNEAMQAELASLAGALAQRRFQERLQGMEQQHRDRIQRIRDSAIETEEQVENRRFNDVMARLNEEQQARLAALRTRYGKGEDADSQREKLEEEHRRRMMGLYTKSGREQERKRYEAASKELAYQEEEADLLESFQDEKADAEIAHKDELESIRQRDIQRQVAEENQRYADAVAEVYRQQALKQQDAAARSAIEANYAAQRTALEQQLNAQLAAIRQQEIARRIADENAAYARQQEDFQRSRDRAEATFRESQLRIRLSAIDHWYEMGLISAAGAVAMYEAAMQAGETTWEGPRPWERERHYAAGTSYHPGGLAIVGEQGPELLDLPRGASVTPMSRTSAAGGNVEIHNHFGEGSVRSERDILRIAESVEKSFRLRGVRTL